MNTQRRRLRTATALAVAGLLAAACSTPASAPGATQTPQAVTQTAIAGATASPGVTATPGGDIVVQFAGDVHFFERTATLLKNPQTAFGPIATQLRDSDLTVLNLETAVTARGTAQPKTYHFRTNPTAFDALRAAGVDAVTIANNHLLDYGRVGLADTLAAVKAAKFPAFGAGNNADEAWAPWLTTVKGTKFAFIGLSYVNELASDWIATPTRSGEALAFDLPRTVAAVKAAQKEADVVVVFMHWGTEGDSCPNSGQKSLAQKLADAGANVIIGSHVHTLQGSGWLGHTFVAYGMGNFLWYGNSWSQETGVLRLTFHAGADEPAGSKFIPAFVTSTGQPVVQTGAKGAAISQRYASLRTCAGLSAKPTTTG
jgi:poly-gamma-glutamate synthesis protein (capsule biosynthesis protein)